MIQAKLELGVGDDDAALKRIGCRAFVDSDRNVANLCRQLFADEFDDFLEADVLVVVAGFGLATPA